ncbi:type II toxin-antitoxin system RelE/ParE family toxin [Candidatus Woesearchaeota archaeon]|nr:type II toxin-antitoxin system RelE/ParE family toxin [Candidatus Woesearchaeota archaeon]
MLVIEQRETFLKKVSKIKHQTVKEQIKKQVEKIIENPEIGKPMRYSRKGTRELYIKPYRLAYAYFYEEEKLIFIDLYHKDEQ